MSKKVQEHLQKKLIQDQLLQEVMKNQALRPENQF